MNQLEALQIFVRVAELGSFTQASVALTLPKASVSNAVQQLETLLETRLLHRTTRKVQMTQDGQIILERAKDLLDDFEEIQTLFSRNPAQLRGRLRVDMPLPIARNVVLPRLYEFMGDHPELEIELSSTDRLVDPVHEGFDCVLRVGKLGDSSLIARPLGEYHMINVASPGYLERYGIPKTLDDLSRHRLVHYVSTLGARSPGFEYVDPSEPETTRFLPMPGALTVNNSDSYLNACLAGLGIIQSPQNGLNPQIKTGQLIEILPKFRPAPMPVSLIYPNRRQVPKRVQAFMAWIGDLMQAILSPTDTPNSLASRRKAKGPD